MTDQEELIQALNQFSALLRVAHFAAIKELLTSELNNKSTLLAYIASDGTLKQTEIAEKAAVSQGTISKWWGRWLDLGLALEGNQGKAKALFNPALYGIDLSSVSKKKVAKDGTNPNAGR